MDVNPVKANGGHSATVEMWLHIAGQSLPVAQAGDKALKLRGRIVPPTGPASLEIIVDGCSRRSPIAVVGNGGSPWVQIDRDVSELFR